MFFQAFLNLTGELGWLKKEQIIEIILVGIIGATYSK